MDQTEAIRKERIDEINAGELTREVLEIQFGKGNVWSTDELTERFDVLGFLAPFVAVRDKATGKKGTCEFSHMPRFYFNYQED